MTTQQTAAREKLTKFGGVGNAKRLTTANPPPLPAVNTTPTHHHHHLLQQNLKPLDNFAWQACDMDHVCDMCGRPHLHAQLARECCAPVVAELHLCPHCLSDYHDMESAEQCAEGCENTRELAQLQAAVLAAGEVH